MPSRDYYAANRDRLRAARRAYYAANRERQLAVHNQWREANRDLVLERNRTYSEANRERLRQGTAERKRRVRNAVLDHYGRSCACCGSPKRLEIDHVNGDGAEHRKELFGDPGHAGYRFYLWLIDQEFPEGFQTLCHKCNMSKGRGSRCRINHGEALAS